VAAQRRARVALVAGSAAWVGAFVALLLVLAGVAGTADRHGGAGARQHDTRAIVLTATSGGLALGAGNRPEHPLLAGAGRGTAGWTVPAAAAHAGPDRWVRRLGWWSPALPGLTLDASGTDSRRGRAPPIAG
jgi:hypothetical protein